MSLIKRRLGSRWTGVTNTYQWLRVIVYNALVGHVDVVRILHSTRHSNTPDRWRDILPMAFKFRLANGGSGRDLRIDE